MSTSLKGADLIQKTSSETDEETLTTQADFSSAGQLAHDPDIKAYIYQMTHEFAPYVTSSTTVTVVARDPSVLHQRFAARGKIVSKERLAKMHRIAVVLTDQGTQVTAEALHENIFFALRKAKEKLVKHLSDIHNSVISEQERLVQMRNAQENSWIH